MLQSYAILLLLAKIYYINFSYFILGKSLVPFLFFVTIFILIFAPLKVDMP